MQPAPTAAEQRPVFVLGTGRCGSTFVQSLLCATEDLWVWGEHDGALLGLFAWGRRLRESRHLAEASYPFAAADPVTRLRGEVGAAEWMTAWINGFTPATVEEVERAALLALFAKGLPAGKRRWGFKEIRYAAGDDTAERLLQLFPAARIIHVVRHPCATVESSLVSWEREPLLRDAAAGNADATLRRYATQIGRWEMVTGHLMALEAERPEAVRTLRIEHIAEELPQLARFLDVPAEALMRALAIGGGVNTGPRLASESATILREAFQACRAACFPQIAALAGRLRYAVDPAGGGR